MHITRRITHVLLVKQIVKIDRFQPTDQIYFLTQSFEVLRLKITILNLFFILIFYPQLAKDNRFDL